VRDSGWANVRAVRWALIALVAAWSAYFVNVVLPVGDAGDGFFKTYVFSGVLLAAAGMCAARAAIVRADRVAWGLLALGMVSWALATVVWSAFLKDLAAPPYPSVADALYLGFYPPAYAALILLLRPLVRSVGVSLWLDGVVGVLAISAIGAAFLLPSIVADTSGDTAVVATNLAYPLCDLALIAMVVGGFVLTSGHPGRAWSLIGAGLILFAVADTIYLLEVAKGTFSEGTWLDSIWPAGMVLLALAAGRSPERRVTHGSRPTLAVAISLPLLLALSSVVVLVYGNFERINAPATFLASLAVVFALARLFLSFREIRQLGESRRQATTDELTGLPNRRGFFQRLNRELSRGRANGTPVTLVISDLDGFKELNDTLGHHAGDTLLQQLGPRMLDVLRYDDMVARLGGDEFAVLLPNCDAERAAAIVADVCDTLDQPFTIDGLRFHVEASFGIATFPEHADTADLLVRCADVAMYQAKDTQTSSEVYASDRDTNSRERLSLLADLRSAMDNQELELYYQPKVDLRTDQVSGVEALIRWNHPERGLLQPVEFLPYVERLTLMRPLTLYVLDAALAQVRRWRDDGLDLAVAVNLAVPNLLDTGLPDDLRELLERHGVPADRLCLEVTENIILADPERVLSVLLALKQTGVSLALDDFGAGASSLAYLKRLPLDELKIDKSFVLAMEESQADAVIVRSTTDLAHRLGMRVVAEGVETAATLRDLQRAGCEEAQGYLLSRPVPAAGFEKWLRERRSEGGPAFVADVAGAGENADAVAHPAPA